MSADIDTAEEDNERHTVIVGPSGLPLRHDRVHEDGDTDNERDVSPVDRARAAEAHDLVHDGNEAAKNGEPDGEPASAIDPIIRHVRSSTGEMSGSPQLLRQFQGCQLSATKEYPSDQCGDKASRARDRTHNDATGERIEPAATGASICERRELTVIGGLFFRASDPKALSEWYERHLGVTRAPTSYSNEPWRQETGWTVFAPFPADTKYFGRTTQQWMINFRVRHLDAMVAQLTGAGIAVDVDRQAYPNGRFARLQDPEGNPIQLWEPRNPSGPTTPDL